MNIKERPRIRKAIVAGEIRPYTDAEGYWDGITAVWPDGHVSCLCSSFAKQMRRMVELGDLGEIMKRTWVCRNGQWHARITPRP